jgi:predicted negative regulator of RcsB-dependent stress response
MATHLDLDEQEQLDQLKQFWKQYGNLITWTVIIILLGYAGWQGWNWYQRDQSAKAAAMFDALEVAANAGDADKSTRVFGDMKDRYPRTAFTQQAALLAAKVQHDKGQLEAARGSLGWAADHASEQEYRTVARLRLAGLLLDEKKYDEALKQLDGADAPEFVALVADRRGDVLLAQGKREEAKSAYSAAWKGMDDTVQYRVVVEAKLVSLGAAPEAAAAASGASK